MARVKHCPADTRGFLALAALLCAAPLLGCNQVPASEQVEGGAGGDAGQCPAGQIRDEDAESCIPVGIQGCNALFVNVDDGLCHPSMDRCMPGSIPELGKGCVAVGIPGCMPDFVGEDGVCRPTMTQCAPGMLAIPQEGCVPLDGPDGCGDKLWGNLVDTPGDVYVDPTSPAGEGAGSRESPFTTLAAAMDAVHDGGRVVLAGGDYDEAVEITKPIELVGRCASLVTLRGEQLAPDGNVSAVWLHDVAGAGLRGVHVISESIGVLVQGAEVALHNVHVSGSDGTGVAVTSPGASLAMSRCLIESTTPAEGSLNVRTNVLLLAGAHASLAGSALVNGNTNLRVNSDAQQITVEDTLIEDLVLQADESGGFGALVDAGTLRLSGTAIVGNRVGVLVTGPGAELIATGSVIAAPSGGLAKASDVTVDLGARASLDASVLSGPCDAQLTVSDAGTRVTATGNLFQGAAAGGSGEPEGEAGTIGRGIALNDGSLTLTSNAIQKARDVGLMASGGSLSATGNIIEGTRASPLYPALSAGVLLTGAQAVLKSTYVSGSRLYGIAHGAGASLELTESLVENTMPDEVDGTAGIGLVCSGAASTSIRGSAVLKSHAAGLLLFSSPAKLEGTLIRGVESGTFSSSSSGDPMGTVVDLADGLIALGSAVELSKSRAEGCARAGLLFDDSGGSVASSSAAQNRFGLVLQGERTPEVEKSNRFDGNSEGGQIKGGSLAVPRSASLDR